MATDDCCKNCNGGSNGLKNHSKSQVPKIDENDLLVTSNEPEHPANLICELCKLFYNNGWVTGTGGGISIRDGYEISI